MNTQQRTIMAKTDSDIAMDEVVNQMARDAGLIDDGNALGLPDSDQPRRTLDATVARMPDLRKAAAIPDGATNGKIRAASTVFNTRIFDDEGRCIAVICDGPASHIDPERQFTESQCKANAARIVALWNRMDDEERDRDRRQKLKDNAEKPERDWERETQRDLDRDRG